MQIKQINNKSKLEIKNSIIILILKIKIILLILNLILPLNLIIIKAMIITNVKKSNLPAQESKINLKTDMSIIKNSKTTTQMTTLNNKTWINKSIS
jgi:hypothetical protein